MVAYAQGGHVGFDAGVYVPPPPETVNYLQATMDNYRSRLGGSAQNLYQSVVHQVASFDYEKLAYMAQAVVRTVNGMWMDNVIQPLWEIGHFQQAPQVMVRWLMAEPTIRQLYHNGEAEGYGDRYIDISPGVVGAQHHEWQIVNDGMYSTDEDGSDVSTEYFYDSNPQYDPEFDELNVNDAANIMRSWTHMAEFARAKRDDPTSKWNSQL